MKRGIVGSDPGGTRVLKELYPATSIENNWIKFNKFSKMHYQFYDEILIFDLDESSLLGLNLNKPPLFFNYAI